MFERLRCRTLNSPRTIFVQSKAPLRSLAIQLHPLLRAGKLRTMTTTISPNSALAQLLRASFTSAVPKETVTDLPANELIKVVFPHVEYKDSEKAEIHQWLITSAHLASADEDKAKTTERLSSLNTHLSTRTTVLGSKPSLADIALFSRLAPAVSKWSPEERTGEQGYHHIVRHLDFVQSSPLFELKIPKDQMVDIRSPRVDVMTTDPRACIGTGGATQADSTTRCRVRAPRRRETCREGRTVFAAPTCRTSRKSWALHADSWGDIRPLYV